MGGYVLLVGPPSVRVSRVPACSTATHNKNPSLSCFAATCRACTFNSPNEDPSLQLMKTYTVIRLNHLRGRYAARKTASGRKDRSLWWYASRSAMRLPRPAPPYLHGYSSGCRSGATCDPQKRRWQRWSDDGPFVLTSATSLPSHTSCLDLLSSCLCL